MTNEWRQIVQRRYDAWRQLTGDHKMIFKRWRDRPIEEREAFASWLETLRGAKTGTVPLEVIEEVRAPADGWIVMKMCQQCFSDYVDGEGAGEWFCSGSCAREAAQDFEMARRGDGEGW